MLQHDETPGAVAERESRYILGNYSRTSFHPRSGEGARLFDAVGKGYWDLLGGIAVNALGHHHPRIERALREAMEGVLHVSNLYFHPAQGILAQMLVEKSLLDRVFFCNSGTEANEAALKFAKLARPGRSETVALEESFHGRTMGSLSITGHEAYRTPFEPLVPGAKFIAPNDIEALRAAVTPETLAIVLEPILGEGGVVPLTDEFLAEARKLADRTGAILIFDEIQCGLGRTGSLFAFQQSGVIPDMVTLAKPLGGGLPLGAVLLDSTVSGFVKPGHHGTTFGGNPVACRLGIATLEAIEEERLLERVATLGSWFELELQALKGRNGAIVEVRGSGMMWGIELDRPAAPVARLLLEQGIIVGTARERTLRLLPPYVVPREALLAFVDALDGILVAGESQSRVSRSVAEEPKVFDPPALVTAAYESASTTHLTDPEAGTRHPQPLGKGSMNQKTYKRVALAYSGGLDTSIIIPWLKENYGCEVVAVAVDVGQAEETRGLEEKAYRTGAVDFHLIDAKEEFASDYIFPTLKAGAIYEKDYLLGTSMARPLIAQKQVEIALETGCDALAHGCTGKGNDQVRFELAYGALAPELGVVAPWRAWDIVSREDAIDYAIARGIEIPVTKKDPYSRDRNLWHISHEGGPLEDPAFEPEESMFRLTTSPQLAPDIPEKVSIGFGNGLPVSVNGEELSPASLIEVLNEIGGRHGVGRADLVENRLIGIKSRGVYETPGGTLLVDALKALESLTLDRDTAHERERLSMRYAELVYFGQWFSPLKEALDVFMDKTMETATGSVTLSLYKGHSTVVSRTSPFSLYSQNLASFDMSGYDVTDSAGFIKLFGLPTRGRKRIAPYAVATHKTAGGVRQ